MLYLKPPFHIIKGVTVFSDHARPDICHYAPAVPHMTMRRDPTTGTQIPQFQLLKFRNDAAGTGGGFLNFSVDLSIPDDLMAEVKSELRRILGLREEPQMSPITFEDGDVQLMILGAQSNSADDDDPNAGDEIDPAARFVKAVHHSKPSLYGDNNAIFSVELDAEGVQLMEAALQSNISGVGVIYALHFYALRPAYNVKVSVDWERVQTHFEESFSGRLIILSTDVAEVVDELIEDRVVLIEVDTFLPEGDDAGSWVGNRNKAIEEFKSMITETFFTPVTPPGRANDDTWSQVSETAEQVGLLLATGGWSGVASLTYRRIETTQIDHKTMNLSMRERVTMRKSIYPQAVLEGLLQLKDENGQPLDLSRFVHEVTLGDPWFEDREVTAFGPQDFALGHIGSLNVDLDYHGEARSLRLSPANKQDTRDWPSRLTNGLMDMEVGYHYSVEFTGVDVAERPGRITSPPLTTTSTSIDVEPQRDELFFIDEITVGTSAFPWDRFPTIEVHLRYDDPANGIALNDSFLLNATNTEIVWQRFRMDKTKRSYDIRRVFHGADNRNREFDWQEMDQELLLLTDPMPQNRTVTVVPNVDWTEVSMVLVEVEYNDTDNGISKIQPMTFSANPAENRMPQSFFVGLVDQSKRFVLYRAKIIMANGTLIDIPTSETQETFLTISPTSLGHRVIELRGPESDFAVGGLRRIEVELTFEDAAHGLAAADKLIFDGPGQVKFFEFDYADDAVRAVHMVRTDVHLNGLQSRRDLGQVNDNRIVLDFG